MTALASRRRRRTWYALGAGALVLAAIPVLGVAGWRAIRDSESALDVTSIADSIPVTPTAMLGGVDDDGRLTTLALLALAPGGAGGSVVSVPVGASVTGADGTRHRLADAYAEGGVEQLQSDLESLMLVTVDVADVVDESQLTALLDPVGPITVDLPSEVLDGAPAPPAAAPTTTVPEATTTAPRRSTSTATTSTTTTSTTTTTTTTLPPATVVAPSGSQQLDPAGTAEVLLASVDGQSETARLPTNAAVWNAVAAAVGEGRPGVSPVNVAAGGIPDLTSFTESLWSGPVGVWQLGVTPITSPTENPAGADLLQTDLAEAIMVVATIAPSAASAVLDGASVQLTSGFDDWRVTRDAVATLAYIGANVMVIITTTDAPPATSEVLAGSASVQPLAEEYANALGADTVGTITAPVAGIEVHIVLGESFVSALEVSGTQPRLDSVPSPRDTVDENLATTTTSSTDTTVAT